MRLMQSDLKSVMRGLSFRILLLGSIIFSGTGYLAVKKVLNFYNMQMLNNSRRTLALETDREISRLWSQVYRIAGILSQCYRDTSATDDAAATCFHKRRLGRAIRLIPEFRGLSAMDTNGVVLSAIGPPLWWEESRYTYPSDFLTRKTIEVRFDPLISANPGMVLSTPLHTRGAVVARLSAYAPMDKMSGLLNNMLVEQKQLGLIVDGANRIVAAAKTNLLMKSVDALMRSPQATSGLLEYRDPQGNRYVGFICPQEQDRIHSEEDTARDWRFFVLADVSEMNGHLRRGLLSMLAASLALGGIMAIVVRRVNLKMAGPLLQLTRAIDLFDKGGALSLQSPIAEFLAIERGLLKLRHDLKIAEQALGKSEKVHRELIENAPGSLMVHSLETPRILFANPAFNKMLGIEARALVGTPLRDLIWPEDEPRLMQELQGLDAGTPVKVCRYRLRGGAGQEIIVESRIRFVVFAGERSCVHLITDIAEQERITRAIVREVDAERVRICDELHDGLIQKITGVSLLCLALEDEKPSAEVEPVRLLSRIRELAQECGNDLRHMISFMAPYALKEGDLRDALQMTVEQQRAIFQKPMVLSVPDDQVVVNGDVAMNLSRIVHEGISNAAKHSRCTQIRVGLLVEGQTLILTIEDDGVGLPDPRPLTEGLGLRIMARRAEQIHAALSIQSQAGHGVTIRCSLSLADAHQVEAPRPVA
jgi:PAS domain S-box-containing protein